MHCAIVLWRRATGESRLVVAGLGARVRPALPLRAARHPDGSSCGGAPSLRRAAQPGHRQEGHTPPEARLTSEQPAVLPRDSLHQRRHVSLRTRASADITSVLRPQSVYELWWEEPGRPSRHTCCLLLQPCLTSGAAPKICHFRQSHKRPKHLHVSIAGSGIRAAQALVAPATADCSYHMLEGRVATADLSELSACHEAAGASHASRTSHLQLGSLPSAWQNGGSSPCQPIHCSRAKAKVNTEFSRADCATICLPALKDTLDEADGRMSPPMADSPDRMASLPARALLLLQPLAKS